MNTQTLENKLRQHIKNLDSSNPPEQSEHSPNPKAILSNTLTRENFDNMLAKLEQTIAQRDELLAACQSSIAMSA